MDKTTASPERVGMFAAAIYDEAVDHPMWIGDDSKPLDYNPDREVRLGDFIDAAARAVATVADAEQAELQVQGDGCLCTARDRMAERDIADPAPTIEPPEYRTEDYRRHAVLFNDITHAPVDIDYFRFSDRLALRDYLWGQGWRRDVRPEDVTPMAGYVAADEAQDAELRESIAPHEDLRP